MKPEDIAVDPSEFSQQSALMCWCQQQGIENIFHIPNGGHRSKREASRLKVSGVQAGVPDLFLAQPCGGSAGLFIELKKVKGGRISEVQREWLTRLTNAGYACVVAAGFEAAKKAIEEYLGA